jgi:hypothetical protein
MSKKTIAVIAALAIVMLAPVVNAAEEANSTPQQSAVQANSPQAVGEWEFKSQMPARASTATMTIKKSDEGKYEGTWLAQWGESVLSDITFENGKMKFVQTSNFGGQEMKTTYEGTVADGKITGKAQGQWGDFTFDGALGGETKGDITGEWQMNVTMPAREIVEKLTITKNADGTLAGKWEAQRGENTISDIKFEGGKLTFTRTSRFGDREFTVTFEGTVEGDNIKGVFKSERGEREANATRITSATKAEEGKKPAEVKKVEPNTPEGEKKN